MTEYDSSADDAEIVDNYRLVADDTGIQLALSS